MRVLLSSRSCFRQFCRLYTSSKGLTYSEYGEPHDVLSLTVRKVDPLKEDEVLVKMLASPVHPADVNVVQGVYPVKSPPPAVGGNEGVGKVVECGRSVKSLKVDDLVVPIVLPAGTWQTFMTAKASSLYHIPYSLSALDAAIFATNPSTAYLMLRDLVKLHSGDIVIQNGATSAVGVYAIQIAKLLGFRTVNLFRPRKTAKETEETRQSLLDFGATWAVTEPELTDKSGTIAKEIKDAGPAKLALNCLGGKPAVVLMRFLGKGGILVSYGGMTRNPMPVPVGPLIFKDISLRGFWRTGWSMRADRAKQEQVLDKLAEWFHRKALKPSPFTAIPLEDWRKAIEMSTFTNAEPTAIRKKAILVMNHSG
ncbi:unnamed protein product [Calicophoron daubneyi]|uniref:Enoyl-[acyl-carrier-protein] reductase, mitochondrial n=1 Tax=Calicophoron daubneyi TaxID=300641 RepID=A0AAV2T6H1_CALDB